MSIQLYRYKVLTSIGLTLSALLHLKIKKKQALPTTRHFSNSTFIFTFDAFLAKIILNKNSSAVLMDHSQFIWFNRLYVIENEWPVFHSPPAYFNFFNVVDFVTILRRFLSDKARKMSLLWADTKFGRREFSGTRCQTISVIRRWARTLLGDH